MTCHYLNVGSVRNVHSVIPCHLYLLEQEPEPKKPLLEGY